MRKIDQRIVVVTRKTHLDELTAKFSTRGQARFHLTRARVQQAAAAAPQARAEVLKSVELKATAEVDAVEAEARQYRQVIAELRTSLDFGLPVQVVDRSLVPNMVFGPHDVILAVGQDGLVANVAKYALGLPIIGVNPDPRRFDGILLPFTWQQARIAVQKTLDARARFREVTLAEARLNDGQRLLAFNDLFVGARTHISARYRLSVAGKTEDQSSSGMIVSTGAGSTGWLSSILNMAAGVMELRKQPLTRPALAVRWEDRKLVYVVREPFISKTSSARLVAGMLNANEPLTVESMMGLEGTIFSDGVEADSLAFSAGAIATIRVAGEKARLVVP